ncbi:glycosyltransferase family 39 protein [Limobrevibacterium gyesilva]|uniref:Glycosyltransferase family 39 protein n=1 Tax=Limobrevibacterium gyesilva TaxID=2991712 RepID=A0AA41YRE6_9PROT|nr:glycosyltransferase family 39 protein [Limobrevibacterium gyesilva]MCW3476923.1 glycosyltransferase family 39 protein [Limobrevibacterium gyesilva]
MHAIPRKFLFIPIALLGAFLYFHAISGPSLWNDEGFSFFVAAGGVRDMLHWIENDTQPPLYYLTLAFWLDLGHGVTALRSLSAASMLVALAFVHAAGRELFDRKTALIAMALFAIAPHCVMWAQKARPYAFQTMLVAIAFWGFATILRSADARARALGGGFAAALRERRPQAARTDLAWLAYAAGGGLAMLAQHPAGFFVLGCNCAMAVAILRDRARARVLLLNWVVAQLVLIGIWLLWLPEFLIQYAEHLAPDRIAQRHAIFLITPLAFWRILVDLFSVSMLWRVQTPAFVLYMAMAAWGAWQTLRHHAGSAPFILTLAAPLAVCALGFFLVNPVFGYVVYTFNWILVPYTILIAAGIAAIRIRTVQAGALGVFVLMNLWGLRNYYATSPPPLDAVAGLIGAEAKPGDGIIFSAAASSRFGIAYYLQPAAGRVAGLDASRDGDRLIRTAAAAAGNARNWVVLPEGEAAAVDLAGQPDGWSLGYERHVGSMIVLRYDRRG